MNKEDLINLLVLLLRFEMQYEQSGGGNEYYFAIVKMAIQEVVVSGYGMDNNELVDMVMNAAKETA